MKLRGTWQSGQDSLSCCQRWWKEEEDKIHVGKEQLSFGVRLWEGVQLDSICHLSEQKFYFINAISINSEWTFIWHFASYQLLIEGQFTQISKMHFSPFTCSAIYPSRLFWWVAVQMAMAISLCCSKWPKNTFYKLISFISFRYNNLVTQDNLQTAQEEVGILSYVLAKELILKPGYSVGHGASFTINFTDLPLGPIEHVY